MSYSCDKNGNRSGCMLPALLLAAVGLGAIAVAQFPVGYSEAEIEAMASEPAAKKEASNLSPSSRETAWSAWVAEQVGGEAEHRLPTGDRVDVLTTYAAVEVEWVTKWHEAIGQALWYGMATHRKPSIVALWKDGGPKEQEAWLKLASVCDKHKIHLYQLRTDRPLRPFTIRSGPSIFDRTMPPGEAASTSEQPEG